MLVFWAVFQVLLLHPCPCDRTASCAAVLQAVGLKYNANLTVLKLWLWRDPGKAVMCLTFLFGSSGSYFDGFFWVLFFGFVLVWFCFFRWGGGGLRVFLFFSPKVIFNLDPFPDSDSFHSHTKSCTGTTEGATRISRRSSDCTQQLL